MKNVTKVFTLFTINSYSLPRELAYFLLIISVELDYVFFLLDVNI